MDVWLEHVLSFWEARFDHLDKILQGLVFRRFQFNYVPCDGSYVVEAA